MTPGTLELLARLAPIETRTDACRALAQAVGARAIFVFVPHPDVARRLMPAPGFPSTLPSSRGWRELLGQCGTPGVHEGTVAYPDAASVCVATAYAFETVTVVLVGRGNHDPELAEMLRIMAAPLGATLRAQTEALVARGDLEVAKQSAQRASMLAQALDAARTDAERAARVKDEFLAMLGHELRNPLAPIVTALQLMRMEGVASRVQDVLERQVSHLQRLVDDLLDVSRITRGKVELRKERLEIESVVRHAVEIARPLLEQRRNELALEVPRQGLPVHGDPARLAQVISNLLTNASKYSDPGTPIRVTAERAGGLVRLTVSDRGVGIAPEYLERVFEQFMQVPQGFDRGVGGLGLGLAIVRSLVAMHGGSVRAFSDGLGHGSQFVVELPLLNAPDLAPSAPEPASISARTPSRAGRVLIVDDNRDAAELMHDVLKTYGYRTEMTHSGPDALKLLERFEPEVALLDLGLPVMDGFELAQHLRTARPHLRLVAVTGYGQSNDRERTQAAGFAAHLVKPVTIARVVETLDRLLR